MAFAIVFSPVLLPSQFDFISRLPIEQFPFIFFTIFIFSLFPDLDEPNSYLSKRPPWNIFSIIISSITEHRGVTHRFFTSFIPPILVAVILHFIQHLEFWPLILISWLSYLSHLIGDGFTKGGLRRFYYPFSKKTIWFLPKSLRFKTGSFIETLWLLFFSIILLLEIYIFFQKNNIQINSIF
jgi:membrane-bound metal-dependent hydrolase YbcI (DUF457 family)